MIPDQSKIEYSNIEFSELLKRLSSNYKTTASGSILDIPPSELDESNSQTDQIILNDEKLSQKLNILTKRIEAVEHLFNIQILTTTDWHLDIDDKIKKLSKQKVESNIDEEKQLLRENIQVLSEIGQFEDNWNGYGAKKFESNLIFKCLEIVTSFDLNFQPEIFPTANQSIQFEYEPLRECYLEIEVFLDKYKIYKRFHEHTENFIVNNFEDVLGIINDFHSQLKNSR